MSVMESVLALSEVRPQIAAALAPVADTDPDVITGYVDDVTPPAIMVVWGDPWLTPGPRTVQTFGPCVWVARAQVLAIAARVEVGPGVDKLEELVAYTVARLQADSYQWPAATVTAPREFPVAGRRLLGAYINYDVQVTI